MNVEIVHGVYVKVENRPGTLQNVGRVLAEKKINIDSLGCETIGNIGMIRILTHKAREATETLRHQGIEAFESELVVAHAPNRAGEVAKLCAELAAAQINVEGVVTTAQGNLALRTSDNERAAMILRKL